MKFFKAIGKNFKILFRLKTSLLAVILGPLLIVFLVGIAFNSSSAIDISVGYISPDNTSLTIDFVNTLSDNGYGVEYFQTKQTCVDQLELGLLHMCLIFPENFQIQEGQSKEIIFVVDKTRINIVYAIIDSVSEHIGMKSDALSKSLTDVLIQTLESTSTTIDENLASLVSLQNKLTSTTQNAQTISDNLGNMNLDMGSVSTDFMTDFEKMHEYTANIHEEIVAFETNITLENIVVEKYEDSLAYLNTVELKINSTNNNLENLKHRLEEAELLTQESKNSISSVQEELNTIKTSIGSLRTTFESANYNIKNIEITSSDQIVNPVTTTIETVSADENQLSILFPYALVLIIMFIGMLLSSTLVIIEKKSKAAFRVFTTPTRDEFYLLTTFVTSFIILAAQLALILLASKYFFIDVLSANTGVTILLLGLTTSFFILLGMAIGYLFSSQQATNMASISIGAVFLFISNLILPLETVSSYLKSVTQFNPYVLTSEMLRKSFLFSSSLPELATQFIILGSYVVGMLILIIFVQKLAKNVFFSKKPSSRMKINSNKSQLIILGKRVITEDDFIIAINRLTEEEYEDIVYKNKKEIYHFLSKIIHRKQIARKFSKLNKKELLLKFAQLNEERYTKLKLHHQEFLQQDQINKK